MNKTRKKSSPKQKVFFQDSTLSNNSPIGLTTIIIIIPFSIKKRKKVSLKENINDSVQYYKFPSNETNNGKEDSLMRQFLDRDTELFSSEFENIHSFGRFLFPNFSYSKDNNSNVMDKVSAQLLITIHEDNNLGTVTVINSIKAISTADFLDTLKLLKDLESLYVDGTSESVTQYITNSLCSLFKRKTKAAEKSIVVDYSLTYPYISLGGSELKINQIENFVNNNRSFIYGLIHQDLQYNGWERVRNEVIETLNDKNISRRREYGLFISTLACVEIDNDSRKLFIEEWAKKKKTSVENMRLKLLFDRVAILEVLILQKYILSEINILLDKHNNLAKEPISKIIEIKEEVASNLATYYYATSISDKHISGIEWIMYGRQRMGIDNMFEGVMKQVELAESNQELKMEMNNIRGNYIFQLVSVFLGYSALSQFIDCLIQEICTPESIIAKWFFKIDYFAQRSEYIVNMLQINSGTAKIVLFILLCVIIFWVSIRYYRN